MPDYIDVRVNGKIYEIDLRFCCRVETPRGSMHADIEEIPIESVIEALNELIE